MRCMKIIVKETDSYKTYFPINLEKCYIECTYPRDEEPVDSIPEDIGSAITNEVGAKINIVFENYTENLEIDIQKTPAKFFIYDDYGTQIIETTEIEKLEDAILESISCESEGDGSNPGDDSVGPPEEDIPPIPSAEEDDTPPIPASSPLRQATVVSDEVVEI